MKRTRLRHGGYGAVAAVSAMALFGMSSVAFADTDDRDEGNSRSSSSSSSSDKDDDKSEDNKGQDTSGNMVAYGDSYFADSANPADGVGLSGCPQNPDNIPGLTARELGMELKDYTCSGAVAYLGDADGEPTGINALIQGIPFVNSILGGDSPAGAAAPTPQTITEQVQMSIDNGDLSDNTSQVIMSIGGNDGMFQSVIVPEEVQAAGFIDKMAEVIPMIEDAAPNANINLVGYPKMANADESMCIPVHMGTPLPELPEFPIHLVSDQEHIINDYQIAMAEQHDSVTFLDIKESTAGHGPCASDEDRWVSSAMDLTIDTTYTMPLHLTAKANEHISGELVDLISGTKSSSDKDSDKDSSRGTKDLLDLAAGDSDKDNKDKDDKDSDKSSSSGSSSSPSGPSRDEVRQQAEDRVGSGSQGSGGSSSSSGSDDADRSAAINRNRSQNSGDSYLGSQRDTNGYGGDDSFEAPSLAR